MNNQNQAYIISSAGELIAPVETDLKSGTQVQYGYRRQEEFENGKRFQTHIINKKNGKISRDKKWGALKYRDHNSFISTESCMFEDEFFVY